MQIFQKPSNARQQRRATVAALRVRIERRHLGGLQQPIHIIDEPQFSLFAGPGRHRLVLARTTAGAWRVALTKQNTAKLKTKAAAIPIITVEPPFVAGYALTQFVRD